MRGPTYTEAELEWVKTHIGECKNSLELTEKFNSVFEQKRTLQAIKGMKNYRFPNHHYGHSGGKKKGKGFSVTARPVGSERVVGGYTYIKIGNKPISKNFTTSDIRENWVQKQRYIYETQRGKIPPKHTVVFLDGNRENFDIENLYCVHRRIIVTMGRNGWWSDNPQITLTAIKWCELHFALKGESQ